MVGSWRGLRSLRDRTNNSKFKKRKFKVLEWLSESSVAKEFERAKTYGIELNKVSHMFSLHIRRETHFHKRMFDSLRVDSMCPRAIQFHVECRVISSLSR